MDQKLCTVKCCSGTVHYIIENSGTNHFLGGM
jgi:hypothetical protein